ncbi:hypothetical protein S1R3X_000046 [Vibrio phage vB_ValS_VA-RY-4]|nr:hypothetical protein [Vibrio phage vB_VpaS_VP-RY-9]UFD98254.1 hypothetical protein S1R3X_000046 [Vibrio phage vB_ValS_VA-RY-4]CAH0448161.1 hypothetical protein SM030_00028 [Vibrio phage vB_VpaS_sm030]CAI5930019.1 hypothetical protein SM031_00028 [Vibrio phage vB_VpaS_sm030]CAI6013090.1 hypothetical protein SM032_00028 [Vibrio phage vB_VpaS_sm030]
MEEVAQDHGLLNVLEMNLTQLFALHKLKGRRKRDDLISLSYAYRVAQGDGEAFKKYIRELQED